MGYASYEASIGRVALVMIMEERKMNNIGKKEIVPGIEVDIVLKEDQRMGKLTRGKVKDILTKSERHPHGIKVRLEDGKVGRVQKLVR